MAELMDFKERAKSYGYNKLTYPHSENGPKLMMWIETIAVLMIAMFVIGTGIHIGSNKIDTSDQIEITSTSATTSSSTENSPTEGIEMVDSGDTFGEMMGDNMSSSGGTKGFFETLFSFGSNNNSSNSTSKNARITMKNTIHGVGTFFHVIGWIIAFGWSILVIIYLNIAKKRYAEYERNVFKNDIEAANLYRKVQRALNVSRHLAEAKRATKRQSSGKGMSSGNSQPITASAYSQIEEWKAKKKMLVKINTRQLLDDPTKIETVYTVIIELPQDESATASLLNSIKNLNSTVTRQAKGKVMIGDYIYTGDRRYVYMQGETSPIADPYYFDADIAKMNQSKEVQVDSMYSFPLTDFVDRSEEIAEKEVLAKDWAEQQGKTLDSYLITLGLKVTRKDLVVSSSKAAFFYDLALDADNAKSAQDDLGTQLDKALHLKGCSTASHAGTYEVILPIPKDYNIPIDVVSMYRDAFG